LYHFLALSAAAGTSRVDLPNFLETGFVDIVTLSIVSVEVWSGKGRHVRDGPPKCWISL
jgi:hypothetical protein